MEATQSPTSPVRPKQKLFSWYPDTLALLAECKRLSGHESETATIKAALIMYLAALRQAQEVHNANAELERMR